MQTPMRIPFLLLALLGCFGSVRGATALKVTFTLHTANAAGAGLTENRYYYLYRPNHLSRAVSAPMVLVMEAVPGSGPAGFFHRKADQAGFVVVSCAVPGNSLGTVWNNKDPRETGFEDYDYTEAVIKAVRLSDNAGDAFICGLSKGGHMAYAYACERPPTIRAACSMNEFMGLTSNRPKAPVPIMAIHGTLTVWFTTMGIKRDKDGKFAADGPWIGRATGADAPSPVLKIAPDEPVIGLGAEGSWDRYIETICVLRDEQADRYQAWFLGYRERGGSTGCGIRVWTVPCRRKPPSRLGWQLLRMECTGAGTPTTRY
jgi:poly(3-hydroxybutyrate) depolymerase